MDTYTKDSIKGFTVALLSTVAFLTLAYFIVRDDVARASRPVYSPDGTCFMNCK